MPVDIKSDATFDAKGLLCPMPILKTKIEIDKLSSGKILEIIATDPAADPDIRAWAKNTGHKFLGSEVDGEVWKIYVQKK
jgi:TusA-related sulfurtransferase